MLHGAKSCTGSAEPCVIGDVEERCAEAFASLPAMDREKLVLGRLPKLPSLALLCSALRGQKDPAFAAILGPRLERDIAVPQERP